MGANELFFEKGHLLIILHTPPTAHAHERESILFLRKPDGKYLCNGRDNSELKLRRLLEAYDDLFEKYDKLYENSTNSGELFTILEEITPLNRAIKNLCSTLQSARSFIEGDVFLISMRDEADEIARNFELLIIDTKLVLDRKVSENAEALAIKSQEMTESQHKLNIIAAITFPLMAISALMGMNLVHGFEKESPAIF